MKLTTLTLGLALCATPAFAQDAVLPPPVCAVSTQAAASAERLCLNWTGDSNIADQRNCFDADQAANAMQTCVHDAFVYLMDNPGVAPTPIGSILGFSK